ncbi:MAG: hypothetical protein HUU08_03925 [Candidatus Brocadia sp.]|nr:hypothetical protein [Candidatus Brocadia sp.]
MPNKLRRSRCSLGLAKAPWCNPGSRSAVTNVGMVRDLFGRQGMGGKAGK